jgi:hypothetical protein
MKMLIEEFTYTDKKEGFGISNKYKTDKYKTAQEAVKDILIKQEAHNKNACYWNRRFINIIKIDSKEVYKIK